MFDFTGLAVCGNNEIEKQAAGLFREETEKRTRITPNVITSPKSKCVVFKTDKDFVNKDNFTIELSNDICVIKAKGIRGLIFGMGRFLRKTVYKNGHITLIEDISGKYSPSMEIRGHQLGYRNIPNTYDAWSIDTYIQYIKELMFFGCNTFEHTIFDDKPDNYNKLMKYSQEEFLRLCTREADNLDIDVSVWFPNKNENAEQSLDYRKKIFSLMPRIDFYFPPGSDPGSLPADELFKRTIEASQELKKIHPNAKTYPSAQTPDITSSWGNDFIKEAEKLPDEIDGIVTGPNRAFPLHELREKIPMKYPIRLYPDISHNVRCEYPVHFDRDDWHFSLAATMSRETANPRPTEYRTIHRITRQYINGSVTYSEGVSDDVNKFVWSDMDFSPDVSLKDSLEDYARLFFFGADIDKAVNGILGLEKNWEGDPAENPHIENTHNLFAEMSRENPELLDNWRFLLLMFRAKCDLFVKTKRVFELHLIKKAHFAMKQLHIAEAENILTTPLDNYCTELHDEIFSMADKLFHLIGIQLDVDNYGALNWERGATLETIDNPITDKEWLLNRIRYYKSLPDDKQTTFIENLVNRNKTDKDEYYFSFALNGLTELGTPQEPDFYMDFQGDRPNVNNGTIPMSMLKVFDHYSFKCKTGGLTSNKGYDLILNIKPRYRDDVDNFTIKINGNILYCGKQYGGEIDRKFSEELSAPGFETHVYHIPKDFINHGCVYIEIREEKIGVMISEFFLKKSEKG